MASPYRLGSDCDFAGVLQVKTIDDDCDESAEFTLNYRVRLRSPEKSTDVSNSTQNMVTSLKEGSFKKVAASLQEGSKTLIDSLRHSSRNVFDSMKREDRFDPEMGVDDVSPTFHMKWPTWSRFSACALRLAFADDLLLSSRGLRNRIFKAFCESRKSRKTGVRIHIRSIR